jgi:hypothetical protein
MSQKISIEAKKINQIINAERAEVQQNLQVPSGAPVEAPHGTSLATRLRILYLAANPAGTPSLQLDEEIRRVTAKIRAAEHRDRLELCSRVAVRPDDLIQALQEVRPEVVHFSGHGNRSMELSLLNDLGAPSPVSKAALVQLFETLKETVRLVFLNACNSSGQARELADVVGCAVGMNHPITDESAIIHAASFYSALAFGKSVSESFEVGRAALMLENRPEEQIPELFTRQGVDARGIYLVAPVPEVSNSWNIGR